jgi:hypothetical protein
LDLSDPVGRVLERFKNLRFNFRATHPSAALLLCRSLQPHGDPQLLADILNLRVNLRDLVFMPLPFSNQGREVIARDEGKFGLKFAFLVFNDFVDVAHGLVVDVLEM